MDWRRTLFLHTGWARDYDGTEAPEGGHAYLKQDSGVEAANFKPVDGWCYGYAPVSRAGYSRGISPIPKAGRTLNISKLGARPWETEIAGVTVIWTARRPQWGPVVVGLYDDAVVFRNMPPQAEGVPLFIAKARAPDCRLIPVKDRTIEVTRNKKGFPGMAAAWFPGEHEHGPAASMLERIAPGIEEIRKLAPVG